MDYKSTIIHSISTILVLAMFINWLNAQHMSSTLNYRRQLNYMRVMAQKAYEHGIRINEEAQCSKPKPELLYINDNKKIYLPRATLLHRCSDLHGCCPHATHSCEPISTEKVTMYFFVIGVQPSNLLRRNQNIEQLTFVNHTECACKPIDPVWNGNNRPVENSDNSVPFTDSHNNNNNTELFNNTQVRNIRDPNLPPLSNTNEIYLSYQPVSNNAIDHTDHSSETFQGRTNNPNQNHNYRNINRQQTINSYKDNENALKFWAKMMGYNVDKRKILINNHSKRYNKRNVTKKSIGSHSRVSFNTPDVSYSYEIHDNGDVQNYYPHQQPTMLKVNNDLANSAWRQSRKNIPPKYHHKVNNRFNFKNGQQEFLFPHHSSSRLTLSEEQMPQNGQINDNPNNNNNENYHSSLTKMNIVNNQDLPLSLPYSPTEAAAVVPQLAVEPVVPQAYGHYSWYSPINNDINNHIDATPFFQPLWIQ